MFLREILDIVVPLKVELKKRKALNDLLMILDSIQEEVSLLIINRREALSRATSIDEFRSDIDKISDVLAIMALVLPHGVDLFGSNYNAVHPEEATTKKRRRKKSFGHIVNVDNKRDDSTKRPLFQRKRRLGNPHRVLQRA